MARHSYSVLLFVAFLIASVSAHFELVKPTGRGFDEGREPIPPCGGFDSVQTTRSSFPLTGATISQGVYHNNARIEYFIIFSANPTAADFGSNSTTRKTLYPTETGINGGTHTITVDLANNTNLTSMATAGTPATIQILFDGGDGMLYQCADVTLGGTGTTGSKNAGESLSPYRVLSMFAALLVGAVLLV